VVPRRDILQGKKMRSEGSPQQAHWQRGEKREQARHQKLGGGRWRPSETRRGPDQKQITERNNANETTERWKTKRRILSRGAKSRRTNHHGRTKMMPGPDKTKDIEKKKTARIETDRVRRPKGKLQREEGKVTRSDTITRS